MAVVVASLPAILSGDLVPDWIEGSLVMWITTAGTTVMAVTAALNPVWSALGVAAVIGGQVRQAHSQRWRLMEVKGEQDGTRMRRGIAGGGDASACAWAGVWGKVTQTSAHSLKTHSLSSGEELVQHPRTAGEIPGDYSSHPVLQIPVHLSGKGSIQGR